MIVTNADRIFCEECYNEMLEEQEPVTHYYCDIKHGECEYCGIGEEEQKQQQKQQLRHRPATYATLEEDWRQWWLAQAQSDDCDVPPISRQFRDAWTLGLEAGRREQCRDELSL